MRGVTATRTGNCSSSVFVREKGNMQAVILAAGDGTRMAGVTSGPKCLLDIDGVPFLVRQLLWLAENGMKRVIIWTADRHREQMTKALSSVVLWDPPFWWDVHSEAVRSGTGGALQKLTPRLDETFLVVMGDVMLPGSAVPTTIPEWADATMLVTDGARDARNVACEGEQVTEYTRSGGLTHTDAGAWLVRKRLVEVDHDMPWDFEDCVLPWSVRFQAVAAVHTHEEPMHVGTPDGIERARELWSSHNHHFGSR